VPVVSALRTFTVVRAVVVVAAVAGIFAASATAEVDARSLPAIVGVLAPAGRPPDVSVR
jgi:hypothetical protein